VTALAYYEEENDRSLAATDTKTRSTLAPSVEVGTSHEAEKPPSNRR